MEYVQNTVDILISAEKLIEDVTNALFDSPVVPTQIFTKDLWHESEFDGFV